MFYRHDPKKINWLFNNLAKTEYSVVFKKIHNLFTFILILLKALSQTFLILYFIFSMLVFSFGCNIVINYYLLYNLNWNISKWQQKNYLLDYCFAYILRLKSEDLRTGDFEQSDLLELKALIKKKDPTHTKPTTNTELGHYLAGLIDGDGYIDKYTIKITFYILDLPLAIYLTKVLGFGSIYKVKDKNAYDLRINSIIGFIKILKLINGKLRNPKKLNQILRLIETNKGKTYFSEFKDFKLNTSNNLDNYWLAGFSDADASFQIKILNRRIKNKTVKRTEIRLGFQVDQKTSYLLELIKEYLGGSIGYRKKQDTYYYSSVSFKNAQKVVNYFDKYNLLSSKHLNYLKWRSAFELIQKKEHTTLLGQQKIKQIKGNMNSLSKDRLDLSNDND